MTDCRYCNRDLDTGTNDGARHQVCADEFMRRKARNSCVVCAKDVLDSGWADCKSCRGTDANFQDYPGPQ